MNHPAIVFYGVMIFAGMFFGWFFKKLNPLMVLIAFLIFGEFLDFLIKIDHPIFTLPFIFGFLLQTAKPIYEKLSK